MDKLGTYNNGDKMTPERIKEFSEAFAFHLFDEVLIKSHDDKCVVEAKLNAWLTDEFRPELITTKTKKGRKGKV